MTPLQHALLDLESASRRWRIGTVADVDGIVRIDAAVRQVKRAMLESWSAWSATSDSAEAMPPVGTVQTDGRDQTDTTH